MEKKNNKLVDKEKDLKNVVPDTDVGPDVTDASSAAHGESSRSSSNREQMRLINKIDFYKWKINLLTELVDVEREQLEKKRDRRADTLKEKQPRKTDKRHNGIFRIKNQKEKQRFLLFSLFSRAAQ